MSDLDDITSKASKTRAFKRFIVLALVFVTVLALAGVAISSRSAPVILQATVEARQVNVSTKAFARVEGLFVAEGDMVKSGEVLGELSSPEVDALLAQTRSFAVISASLNEAITSGPREENVQSLGDIARSARAAAELAQRTAARMERLYVEGVVSAQRRDEAVSARRVSDLNAQAAEAQYRRTQAGFRSETRAVADAAREAAEEIDQASQENAKELRLVSPISGQVVARLAEEGEVVAPALPILQILDVANPYLVLRIPEGSFASLEEGLVLDGRIPALEVEAEFIVVSISAEAEFSSELSNGQRGSFDQRTFEIRLRPKAKIERLRPGMSVLFDWPK